MASETYDEALSRQRSHFGQHFGCSSAPTFYFIHFHDGGAHWSDYQWGWDLRYLNKAEGEPNQCGKWVYSGIAICLKCYKEKGDEIRVICRQFDRELKENHQETIDEVIARGRKIGVIRYA